MKTKTTWILIANRGEARVYSMEGRTGELEDVEDMTFASDVPHAQEIMADRQGRTFDSSGSGRHAMEWSNDPTDQITVRFAEEICNALENAFEKGRYDILSIAAAPEMLSRIRAALSSRLQDVIHSEADKDYTKTAKIDLADRLRSAGVIY